jgi:hypothetical protein
VYASVKWPRAATPLTLLILILLPLATLVGLFVPGFYRHAAWMIPQARGQDLMTFVTIEPLLIVALFAYRKRPIAAVVSAPRRRLGTASHGGRRRTFVTPRKLFATSWRYAQYPSSSAST